jgi:hypothetical protein
MQVGVICPIDRACVSHADCRACATGPSPRPERWCAYSPEMIFGMTDDGSRRATAHWSVTMLNGCLRQTRLQQATDYFVHLDRVFPAYQGTIWHLLTEYSPVPGVIYEQRFEVPFELTDGRVIKLTGQLDAVDPLRRRIYDLKRKTESKEETRNNKTRRVYKPLPDDVGEDYFRQLNNYRYLVYFGSPQQLVDRDAFGNPLPGGMILYPGVPAQIEVDWLQLHMANSTEVQRYPCARCDFGATEAYLRSRLDVLLADELPPVPADLNPVSSKFCVEWCAPLVREACLNDLAAGIAF